MTRPPPRSPLFPYTTLFRSAGSSLPSGRRAASGPSGPQQPKDRKSTRLNSSHSSSSYAVFCLKKKRSEEWKAALEVAAAQQDHQHRRPARGRARNRLHRNLFFFLCYGDHRDLHSFPTRRSSDLLDHVAEGHDTPDIFTAALRTPVAGVLSARSEEHTSELQSQFHLVCRLLLE